MCGCAAMMQLLVVDLQGVTLPARDRAQCCLVCAACCCVLNLRAALWPLTDRPGRSPAELGGRLQAGAPLTGAGAQDCAGCMQPCGVLPLVGSHSGSCCKCVELQLRAPRCCRTGKNKKDSTADRAKMIRLVDTVLLMSHKREVDTVPPPAN
mmetsp:Transcript_33288/g.73615  ORF Transcript_33288/g.73615 Transcript_33288/m.73615 type:complete len:152 (-) Transcript_33288:194-649(-)